MLIPRVKSIEIALAELHESIDWKTVSELGEGSVEVRLQVTDRQWRLLDGDPCYDLDHSGHWGAATLYPEETADTLHDIAVELKAEVLESIAQTEPVSP